MEGFVQDLQQFVIGLGSGVLALLPFSVLRLGLAGFVRRLPLSVHCSDRAGLIVDELVQAIDCYHVFKFNLQFINQYWTIFCKAKDSLRCRPE